MIHEIKKLSNLELPFKDGNCLGLAADKDDKIV